LAQPAPRLVRRRALLLIPNKMCAVSLVHSHTVLNFGPVLSGLRVCRASLLWRVLQLPRLNLLEAGSWSAEFASLTCVFWSFACCNWIVHVQ
jgi:hypothetical protein